MRRERAQKVVISTMQRKCCLSYLGINRIFPLAQLQTAAVLRLAVHRTALVQPSQAAAVQAPQITITYEEVFCAMLISYNRGRAGAEQYIKANGLEFTVSV